MQVQTDCMDAVRAYDESIALQKKRMDALEENFKDTEHLFLQTMQDAQDSNK